MTIRVLDDNTTVCDPSAEDVRAHAEFIGIDLEKEKHLEWIARESLCAPVPHPWKVCIENEQELFYFNFDTGESVWDHPCDEKYRKMAEEQRKKHIAQRFLPSPEMESTLEDMWCDGIKSHKPTFEEIRSQVEAECDIGSQICLFPDHFPGLKQKLAEFADVTQKDIDDAWLRAAIDVLGRPALRLPHHDDSLVWSYRRGYQERLSFHVDVDFRTLTQDDDQRTSSTFGGTRGSLESFLDITSSSDAGEDNDQFFLNGGLDPRRAIEHTPFDEFGLHDLGDANAGVAPRMLT